MIARTVSGWLSRATALGHILVAKFEVTGRSKLRSRALCIRTNRPRLEPRRRTALARARLERRNLSVSKLNGHVGHHASAANETIERRWPIVPWRNARNEAPDVRGAIPWEALCRPLEVGAGRK